MNLKFIILGIVVALLTFTHLYAYNKGKGVILARLTTDRIRVLKDGQEIDKQVLAADDVSLCAMLGGCGVQEHRAN